MTEQITGEILSLPLYIGLTAGDVDTVAQAVADSLQQLVRVQP